MTCAMCHKTVDRPEYFSGTCYQNLGRGHSLSGVQLLAWPLLARREQYTAGKN